MAEERSDVKGSVFATVEVRLQMTFTQPWSTGEKMENVVAVAQRDARELAQKIIVDSNPSSARVHVVNVEPDVTLRFKQDKR